jgi:hypothetical protein
MATKKKNVGTGMGSGGSNIMGSGRSGMGSGMGSGRSGMSGGKSTIPTKKKKPK